MEFNDWIGTAGVSLVLIAYFLNAWGKLSLNATYFFLNTLGGALSCAAALLIPYWPFVLLEGIWTVVSAIGWWRAARRPKEEAVNR
ncbi:CBU_0592 family membrane protein [Flaviaesturariibacter terrae]